MAYAVCYQIRQGDCLFRVGFAPFDDPTAITYVTDVGDYHAEIQLSPDGRRLFHLDSYIHGTLSHGRIHPDGLYEPVSGGQWLTSIALGRWGADSKGVYSSHRTGVAGGLYGFRYIDVSGDSIANYVEGYQVLDVLSVDTLIALNLPSRRVELIGPDASWSIPVQNPFFKADTISLRWNSALKMAAIRSGDGELHLAGLTGAAARSLHPKGDFWSNLAWGPDNGLLYTSWPSNSLEGASIRELDIETGEDRLFLDPSQLDQAISVHIGNIALVERD